MILVIRIHGMINMKATLEETLYRLCLRRKLSATILNEKNEIEMGMLKDIKEFVSYGTIDSAMLKRIVIARGETLEGKKVNEKDADKIVKDIENGEWKIKRYFRLHPPVKGFKKSTKQLSPRGILGQNKEIAKLVERML